MGRARGQGGLRTFMLTWVRARLTPYTLVLRKHLQTRGQIGTMSQEAQTVTTSRWLQNCNTRRLEKCRHAVLIARVTQPVTVWVASLNRVASLLQAWEPCRL